MRISTYWDNLTSVLLSKVNLNNEVWRFFDCTIAGWSIEILYPQKLVAIELRSFSIHQCGFSLKCSLRLTSQTFTL